eukprot:gene31469-38035_t
MRLEGLSPADIRQLLRLANNEKLKFLGNTPLAVNLMSDASAGSYVAAPPASGKISIVHFASISSQQHGDVDKNVQNAERQGAAFIVKCVERELESADSTGNNAISISIARTELPRVNSSVESLKDVFARHFPVGSRIWVHVDEHANAQMCPRSYHQPDDPGATFSRGALKTLAKVPIVAAIATYTVRPLAIPRAAFSAVNCRVPMALPPFDLDQLLQHVPEFHEWCTR